jgi:hypothetical protein
MIGELTSLSEVGLADTSITDEGMEYLTGLKNLQVLHVKNTGVTLQGASKIKIAIPASFIPPFNMAGNKEAMEADAASRSAQKQQ